MNKKALRWLLIPAVAALIAIVIVAPAGGSRAPVAPSHSSLCSTNKPITTKALQRYARRVGHRVFVVCNSNAIKNGANGRPGNRGPTGAQGPPGAAGTPGQSATINRIVIPRTAVPYPGAPCTSSDMSGCMTDGGNVVPLAQVGPIHIDGLCRHTTPGPGGKESAPEFPAPFLPSAAGESEAQVIVWTETGSLSFKGQAGHRENVPPGPPDYAHSADGGANPPDPVKGEGQHMFVDASNEEVNQDRGTDPATDPGHENDPGVTHLPEYPYMQYAGGPIITSEGHFALANMLAGLDVLGVQGECVFAGIVRSIS